ncbi:FG-GAP-like repeat-containing protein [Streptomyces sp. NPDC058864]
MRRSIAPTVLLTSATALVIALTAPTATAAPQPYKGANTARVQDDFNGDGYRDVAVGAPVAKVGKADGAGAVVVLYGSSSGVSTTRKKVITQDTSGVPGTAEPGDGFGTSVETADLDRDGYADLLIGSPWESIGTMQGYGSITVLWGGAGGLTGGATLAPPTGLNEWGSYSAVIKAADVTGDGYPDVGTGSINGAISFTGPFTRTGAYAGRRILPPFGTTRGLTTGDLDGDGVAERIWLPGPVGGNLNGDVWIEDRTGGIHQLPGASGMVGVVADVDKDGYGDLVLGRPWDSAFSSTPGGVAHTGGEINVWYGSAQGVDPEQTPTVIHQDTAGVPGGGEKADLFGQSLSAGDVNGDGYEDVLVGEPGEAIGSRSQAGQSVLLRGSAAGLTGAGATGYQQDTAGVPGGAEADDQFGAAVHLADVNRDGKADMLTGIPGEDDLGALWVTRSGSSGPVISGSTNVSGKSAGITVGYEEALFGYTMNGARNGL